MFASRVSEFMADFGECRFGVEAKMEMRRGHGWPATLLLVMGCLAPVERAAELNPDSESARPTSIAATQHYTLRSRPIDQLFSIDVSSPPGEGPFPVVYILDGNTVFAMTTQMVVPMSYLGDLPPMILVGIGYEVDSPFEVVALRSRDLVPTDDQAFVDRMAARGTPLPDGVRPGGADAFLDFIEGEVKPFIEARYAVDPNDQTLVGDSFGGLFALHVLFKHASSFDRYIAGSPSISWDSGKLFRDEADLASRVDDLPVKLFLSAGSLEASTGGDREMVANVERMTAALRSRDYPGLDLTSQIFPDETHQSVIPAMLSRGLRVVFERFDPDRDPSL